MTNLADLDRRTKEEIDRKRSGKPRQRRQPSITTIMRWETEGGCEATDGCWVEPDGHCEHGKPSWLLVMGLI